MLSKNTNLKGLIPFIVRSVSKNVISEGKSSISWTLRTITSSEKTGDAIAENTSMATV